MHNLSINQRGLWFLCENSTNNIAYNEGGAIHLVGTLNITTLCSSLQYVVNKSGILASKFIFDGKSPKFDIVLNEIDFVYYDDITVNDRLKEKLNKQFHTSFSLDKGCIAKFRLYRTAENEHVLLLMFHHIVYDGWSNQLFLKELESIYNKMLHVSADERARIISEIDPSLSYLAYVKLETESLIKGKYSQGLKFFKDYLADFPATNIPADYKRSSIKKEEGRSVFKQVNKAILDTLKSNQLTKDYSFNVIFSAAYQILLHRHTNQNDVVFGAPFLNRTSESELNSIGYFSNVLPVRSKIDPSSKVSELLGDTKKLYNTLHEYQSIPFPLVVNEAANDHSLNKNPVFQNVFAYQNVHTYEMKLNDVDTSPYSFSKDISKFDIECYVWVDNDQVDVEFVYDTSLYSEASIDKLSTHYINLLKCISCGDDVAVAHIELFSSDELDEFEKWNSTYKQPSSASSMLSGFLACVKDHPSHPALHYMGDVISYTKLDIASNKYANVFLGDEIQQKYIIFMERSPHLIISMIAVLKGRNTYVPIDPSYPDDKIVNIIESLSIKNFVTSGNLSERLDNILQKSSIDTGVNIFIPDTSECPLFEDYSNVYLKGNFERSPVDPVAVDFDRNDEAYIIFTSGSTGTPKGVLVAHDTAINLIEWVNETYTVSASDKLLFLTSVSFDLSVYDIFGILAAGASLQIVPDSEVTNPERIIEYIKNDEITFWDSAPAMMQNVSLLLESEVNTISDKFRLVFLSGDWVPLNIQPVLKARFPNVKLVALGGATEATIWSNYFNVDHVDPTWESIPYGRPISNSQYHILDESLSRVPINTVGDLYIGGPCLAKGYINDPVLTNSKFISDPFSPGNVIYKTGDKAKRREDGEIIFIGREDDQAKIRGYRVELGDIRSSLNAIAAIKESIVLVDDSDIHLKSLHAFVLLHDNYTIDEAAIRESLSASLPAYIVPDSISILENYPQTNNGKVDYKALKASITSQRNEADDFLGEFENTVLDVFLNNIRNKNFSLDANFFAIGGNSILGFRIIREIENVTGVRVPITTLFETRTIREFISHVEKNKEIQSNSINDAAISVNTVDSSGDEIPLSDLQKAYWVGSRGEYFNPIIPHLVLQFTVRDFEINRFAKSVNTVISNNDALKCKVNENGNLIISEDANLSIKLRIASDEMNKTHAVTEAEVYHRLYGPSFSEAPMMSAEAITFERETTIIFSINLVACDGMSVDLLFNQIFTIYNGKRYSYNSDRITFAQYQKIACKEKLGDQYLLHKKYWMDRVSEIPFGPRLPVNSEQSLNANGVPLTRHTEQIDRNVWDKFKLLCRQAGISTDLAVMTLFSEVIGRWSETDTFSLVVMYFSRQPIHNSVSELIGNFATTTISSFNTGSSKTFSELVKGVQSQFYSNIANNLFTGVEVLQEMSKLNKIPVLIPYSFASGLNISDEGSASRSWADKLSKFHLQVPQIALDHQIYEDQEGNLVIVWDVLEPYFKPGVIDSMLSCYVDSIVGFANHSSWEVSACINITESDSRLEANRNFITYDNELLHDGFCRSVTNYPDNIALIGDGVKYTYKELDEITNSVALQLKDKFNVEPGERVAFLYKEKWKQVVCSLSILKTGCVYVPINYNQPLERIPQLVANSDIKVLITNREVDQVLCFDADFFKPIQGNTSPVYTRSDPSSSAYIIFTSGSTGIPKGVEISHGAVTNTIHDINRMINAGPDDSTLCVSALGFDLSIYDLYGLWGVGGKAVLPDTDKSLDPEHLLSLVKNESISVWNSVPEYMKILTEYGSRLSTENYCDHIKSVLLSGDWIPLDLPAKIRNTFNPKQIYSLGGATEASIWSIYYNVGDVDPEWTSIPYGKPLANQKFHVLNKNHDNCPDYVAGDLYISGVGLAEGYINDPEKTSKAFICSEKFDHKLYRTGDRGYYLPDGNICLIGRDDNQVKIQGYRIELGEVEAALNKHEKVGRAIVVDCGDKFTSKYLAAFIVGDSVDSSELISFLGELIPNYMIPRYFHFIDELPLNANGKVDRSALRKNELARDNKVGSVTVDSSVMNESQKQLLSIFGKVLENDDISLDDSFFDLGGTSFLAIKVLSLIKNEMNKTVTLPVILRHQSVRELADHIGSNDGHKSDATLIRFNNNPSKPLLLLFHPIGGSTFCYRTLSKLLGDQFEIICVGHPALSGDCPSDLKTIELLASKYCNSIATELNRKFYLGGWSMGGLIAHEAANKLVDAGHRPEGLLLIDSYIYRPVIDQRPDGDKELFARFIDDFVLQNGIHKGISMELLPGKFESVQQMFEYCKEKSYISSDIKWEEFKGFFDVYSANSEALYAFEGRKTDIPTLLIVAADEIKSYFDDSLIHFKEICGNLEVVRTAGTHYTIVEELAESMCEKIVSYTRGSDSSVNKKMEMEHIDE